MHPLVLALTIGLSALPSPATEGSKTPIFPYRMHVETLDNGLRAIIVPMSSNGLVSYRSAVRTGGRDEYEEGHTGFAHFFEHMMFRGTRKYPADVYGEIITKMGADSNAYTSTDVTVYQLDIAAEDLEQAMDIESDRFMNLAYEEPEFKTEAGAVYGEYRKNKSSPFFSLRERMLATAFRRHTYGHTVIGLEQDIKAMPTMFKYSKSFFSRYYRPENVIIVIAGDVDVSDTVNKIKKYYGSWKKGYVPPKVKRELRQRKQRRVDIDYDGRSLPIVSVGYKGGAYDPEDRTWVASVLLADLAFGETSEIYRRLQLEEQVVQFISASPATDRDPGLWSITAMVKNPSKIDYVLGQIDGVVDRVTKEPPGEQQLAEIKSRRKYSFLMGLDTPARVAGQIARAAAITGRVDVFETFYRTMDAVTPADVVAAAKKYLVAKQRTVAVLREQNK